MTQLINVPIHSTGQTSYPFAGLWLYEIGNGRIGESFVRVYTIATCEAHALMAALASFQAKWPETTAEGFVITGRMPIIDGAVSLPSDGGLDLDPAWHPPEQ